MIHACNLSKIYKTNKIESTNVKKNLFGKKNIYGVKNISFDIKPGEMVGYIGMNGAGKSTTIKLLTGILKPSTGNVEVAGIIPYRKRKQLAREIGVVFGQRNQLWWDLPLIDSLELIRSIYGVPLSTYTNRLEQLSNVLNVNDFLNVPVRQLSLGQRMRGNLIAALLHNPKILFLDEPTLGLDINSRHEFIKFIKSLKSQNTTVFLTTHNMRDIEELCSRIIILDKGSIVYDGKLEDIYNDKYGKYIINLKFQKFGSTMQFPPEVKENGELQIQAKNEAEKEKILNYYLKSYVIENISITENNLEGFLLTKNRGQLDE